jgi:hypothetical protein
VLLLEDHADGSDDAVDVGELSGMLLRGGCQHEILTGCPCGGPKYW